MARTFRKNDSENSRGTFKTRNDQRQQKRGNRFNDSEQNAESGRGQRREERDWY